MTLIYFRKNTCGIKDVNASDLLNKINTITRYFNIRFTNSQKFTVYFTLALRQTLATLAFE